MITPYNQEVFTEQWTMTFSQVYPDVETFMKDYSSFGLTAINFQPTATDESGKDFLKVIYVLLMGEYANSAIANLSVDQFKARLFTRIMAYGPEYQRKITIQRELLNMSFDELITSSKTIYNTARNPSKSPETTSTEELPYINAQNVTSHKRSTMDAYSMLINLLDSDLTKIFIRRFDDLFTIEVYYLR